MWVFALLMELGPYEDREKLWPGWELNPLPTDLITAALPTELLGQVGAGRGKWRFEILFQYKCYVHDQCFQKHNPSFEWQTSYLFFHFTHTQSIPVLRKDPVNPFPAEGFPIDG